jgi:hypothetical protein
MKRLVSFIFVLAAMSQGFCAEVAKPAASAPQPSPAAKEEARPIELKTKSAFALEATARNPFWPIGWKPAAKISDNSGDHGGIDLAPTAFLVSSITIENNTKFAIVNGKIMQEGQQFGLQLGNQTYQVTLKRIEDGRIVIGRRDQEIVIPLRRK